MQAAVNNDRENPEFVDSFTRAAREIRTTLRGHPDDFADPAFTWDYNLLWKRLQVWLIFCAIKNYLRQR